MYQHWYINEGGMDYMEFSAADKNIRDLITDYEMKQEYTINEESEEEDDDDDDDYEEESDGSTDY